MNIPTWHYIASMSAYIVFLLILIDVMRKHPKLAFFTWIAVLFTFPLWDQVEGWFRWAKTFSVLFPTALIVGTARLAWLYRDNTHSIARFFRGDWVLKCLYAVLFLNIAEATLKDYSFAYKILANTEAMLADPNFILTEGSNSRWIGHLFNAICGTILCITIPFPRYKNGTRQYWLIDKGNQNELLFYSTAAWNFLYTTWNMCFVFGESHAFFGSSFCILMAAELYPALKKRPELYIISRVYSLAFHILARAMGDIFTPVMNSAAWFSEDRIAVWGTINIILHIPFVIWYFRKQREAGEPPYGENPPPRIEDCVNEYDVVPAKTATA